MPSLLCIETSPRAQSVSSSLTHEFLASLTEQVPGLDVKHRNLTELALANLDGDGIEALRASPANVTAEQQATIKRSDALIDELKAADAILIAAPMHNFSVPATLRTWIDYVVRPGLCFAYGDQGPYGLLSDKPVLVISARGGDYGDPESPAAYDQQTPYLKQILGFIGLRSVKIIAANGMDMGEEPRSSGIAAARAALEAYSPKFAQALSAA